MIRAVLFGLAAAAAAPDARAARLELDARVIWSDPRPDFGGFSGLEVDDDGGGFVAIGDRGVWARGRLERTDGRLTGVETTAFGPLRSISGERVRGGDADAEGLARDPEGRFYVSYESFHRIRRHEDVAGPAENVPGHADFPRLQENSALEALAVDAEGTLYAVPERSGAWERPFPVYRLRGGVWDKDLSLPRVGSFLVAGADFGPDGRLYLLERDFNWLGGFATRVRRFSLGPDGFDEGEILLQSEFGSTDNFEGVSVWRDAGGDTRVTLIADDNFFALQSTVLAEHLLVEE